MLYHIILYYIILYYIILFYIIYSAPAQAGLHQSLFERLIFLQQRPVRLEAAPVHQSAWYC